MCKLQGTAPLRYSGEVANISFLIVRYFPDRTGAMKEQIVYAENTVLLQAVGFGGRKAALATPTHPTFIPDENAPKCCSG